MPASGVIYLLNAATTPLDPRVRERMIACLEEDPAREGALLADARRARRIVEEARERVALFVGSRSAEIVFTSGGTEANNLALKGAAFAAPQSGGRARRRLLAAATEHSSVLYPARTLRRFGFELVEAPVGADGLLDLERLASLLDESVLMISVGLVNAETGVIQDLAEVVRLARGAGALVHTDACAAAAHLPLRAEDLGVDLMSISAHKFHGPRGAGALHVREGTRLAPLIEGGVAEGGLRGGAENVAGIAGLGEAAALATIEREAWKERAWRIGRALWEGIAARVPGVTLNGSGAPRVESMVNLSVAGVDGEALIGRLAKAGIAVSSGSSCFDEAGKPSHVLAAMGVPAGLAKGSVLLAAGRGNGEVEAAAVLDAFAEGVADLRALAPVEVR